MYVSVCMYVSESVYVCMYKQRYYGEQKSISLRPLLVCARACYVHIYACCKCVCVYVCICACVNMCMCVCVYMCMCECMSATLRSISRVHAYSFGLIGFYGYSIGLLGF